MGFEKMPQPSEAETSSKKGVFKKAATLATAAAVSLGMASHALDANTAEKTFGGEMDKSKTTYKMSAEELEGMQKSGLKKKQLYNSAIRTIQEEIKPGAGISITGIPGAEKEQETKNKAYEKILKNEDTRIEYDLKENKIIFHVEVDGVEHEFPFTTLDLVEDPERNIE